MCCGLLVWMVVVMVRFMYYDVIVLSFGSCLFYCFGYLFVMFVGLCVVVLMLLVLWYYVCVLLFC